MKKNQILILCIGVLIVLLTGIVFFLGIAKPETNQIKNTLFGFIIFAELVLTVGIALIINIKDNTFLKAGTSSVLFLYLLLTIMVSVLMMLQEKTVSINAVIISHSIIIILSMIMLIMLNIFSKKEGDKDE